MILFQVLSAVLSVLSVILIMMFVRKEKTLNIMLKVSSVLLFVCIFLILMIKPYDPLEFDAWKEISSYTTGVLTGRYDGVYTNKIEALLIIILKWFTNILIGTSFTNCLRDTKELRFYNIILLPLSIVLNFIFFKENIFSIVGNYHSREILESGLFFTKILIMAIIFALILKKNQIKEKEERFKAKDIISSLYVLPLVLILFPPIYILQFLFGQNGAYSTKFNVNHIIMLALTLALFIYMLLYLKKRSTEEKKAFLLLIAFASFYQYYSRYCTFLMPLEDYPLHICNTAVIFMLIAIIFNVESLFYFTYFCNTLGALFALLMPNKGDFYSSEILEFWYNHILDFVFPFLAVSLGVFRRPKFKDMVKAIGVFTVYVLIAQLAGAYVNYDIDPSLNTTHVDFFFLYGDKFTSIDLVERLAWNLKYSVNADGTYRFVLYTDLFDRHVYIYVLNTIAIYSFFIVFSFMLWYIVDRIFLTIEDIKLTIYKTKLKKEKIGKTSRKEIDEILKKMEGKAMVNISHFSKKYGGSKNYSVKDFNLTIEDGDVFGFIGHNGAGKSTVIKSLVGIQSITEGTIEINGYDIEKYPLEAKLNIGYVSDNHAVYEKLTGREYINYVADLYKVDKKTRDERIDYYTKMFGLTDALDKEAKGYSHGMKQKLVVIASLIHNPKVWVLDEPLTGLDPTSSYEIKECMREHASKGNIVFFSTHVIEVIEKLCNKIAIISHGELMGVYKIEDLKKDGITLESLYLKYVVSDEKKDRFKEEDIKTTDAGLILEKK